MKKLSYAKVVGTSCDVCDPDDVRKLANFAVDKLGPIDIWVSSRFRYTTGLFLFNVEAT